MIPQGNGVSSQTDRMFEVSVKKGVTIFPHFRSRGKNRHFFEVNPCTIRVWNESSLAVSRCPGANSLE